ncbi:hypothetical protein SAMN04489712_117117 [Thermomonospora echinospora]|uniref:Uncharacterized protein n=1 Tax=Thermomonospora echinospora TaxID=1992 RepID=A0A1H6DIM2_9ACTN|nr:hypothetical protein SAMN04489712_117117 [Thermomonospora echinospora]
MPIRRAAGRAPGRSGAGRGLSRGALASRTGHRALTCGCSPGPAGRDPVDRLDAQEGVQEGVPFGPGRGDRGSPSPSGYGSFRKRMVDSPQMKS